MSRLTPNLTPKSVKAKNIPGTTVPLGGSSSIAARNSASGSSVRKTSSIGTSPKDLGYGIHPSKPNGRSAITQGLGDGFRALTAKVKRQVK